MYAKSPRCPPRNTRSPLTDPVYNPCWHRDGDGVPNRYDRWDNLRHERDGRSWGR